MDTSNYSLRLLINALRIEREALILALSDQERSDSNKRIAELIIGIDKLKK